MDAVLYLIFSLLDCFAIMALIYKTFRWPFWRSFKKLLIIAVVLSIVSYIDRIILDIAMYDSAIQFILYVVFFRYLLKISTFYAYPLAAIGYLLYNIVQFVTYPTLLTLGVVTEADAASNGGFGIYLIQLVTELISYAIAAAFYFLNLGYSYIDLPPHTGYESKRRSKFDVAANAIGTLAVIIPMYVVLNYQAEHIYILLGTTILALVPMFYLCRRKDFGI